MSNRQKLYLIDAYALIFRGYYAFIKNPRINSKGMDTSAIMGFMNSILDLIKREKPENLAVAFDLGGSVDRIEIFKEYKANRHETPDPIKVAVPYIHNILDAMGIPILMKSGYEADDIIGTIAKQAEKNNYEVFMVTPDKDFAQLVSENIYMYKPARMGNGVEIWGVKEVQEKFEVESPIQVIDFLGMMGDSVDNIPGLPGVGEKTAKKFINLYGSIENLLENTAEIKGKLREKIESNKDKGILSKKLATILLDVPIEYNFKDFKLENPNHSKVYQIFEELEFIRMKENFKKLFNENLTVSENIESETIEPIDTDIQYDLFNAPGSFEKKNNLQNAFSRSIKFYQKNNTEISYLLLFEKLQNQKIISLSSALIESDKKKYIGLSFSWSENKSYYLELKSDKINLRLNDFFKKNEVLIIGYNIKSQIKLLNKYGLNLNGNFFDNRIAHYLINPDLSHNFNSLCQTYLNFSFNENSNSQETDLMENSDLNFQLSKHLKSELIKSDLISLFDKVEMPLLKVLAKMELSGIKLDSNFLLKLSIKFHKNLKALEKLIFELSNENFNIASPKQLGEVLFGKMKIIDNPKKTKSGQFSTSEDILSKLASEHKIVEKVLEWRSLQKLLNTYVDSLPKQIDLKSNRIHAEFNQAVASTGRLSSNNPNLQNIPIRNPNGREIRKAFICENEDYLMLSADYSQIELRVIASLSKDPNMISAFKNNLDIHASTAAKVFNVDINQVTKEQRSNAKTVNFGIIYGVSAFGLSNQTSLNRKESKELIESYYNAYPELKKYISNQVNYARENGFVETILGRKRYLKDITSRNPVVRGAAERNAVNAPVQGSAADIIKLAMIKIQNNIEKNNFRSRMLVQVHDELVFEIHKNELDKMKEIIKHEMENVYDLGIPLKVDMDYGINWFEAH
ncbi:MAG: DNA polymerase I [Cryomorphaceae bacterium]|nr:MAG: DNA polymerase I [Cryomorphaceae bacterium]